MKSIENISPSLEKILITGLEKTENVLEIPLFQASIKLHSLENTIFVLYSKLDNYTKKNIVSLFEIKKTESSYLLNSINQIIDDLDRFGEEEKRKETLELYSKVISFCKEISFDCHDLELFLKKFC